MESLTSTPMLTSPSAPQNLTATPGNGRVTLSWGATVNDGGSTITGYQVSIDNGSWIAASSNTSHTFNNLTNGMSYTFRVRAITSVRTGTAASVTATPTATPAQPTPSVDALTQFIQRLYQNVLGRQADQGGLDFWKNALANGQSNGSTISEQFFFSNEYLNRNRTNAQYVNDLYETCMGRPADEGGRDFWVGRLNSGVSRRQLMEQFLQSDEFKRICAQYGIPVGQISSPNPVGGSGSMTGFVQRKYEVFLDRQADAGGLDYWTGRVVNHGDSGQKVAESFVFSNEFQSRQMNNEQFVRYMYRGMMGREADQGGLSFWVGRMNQFPNQEQARRVVFNGLADSKEFATICAQFGV